MEIMENMDIEEIKQDIVILQNQRENIRNLNKKNIKLKIILVSIIVIVLTIINVELLVVLFFILIFVKDFDFYKSKKYKEIINYTMEYKKRILSKIVELEFEGLEYVEDSKISVEQFNESYLFCNYDLMYGSEDLIKGKIGQTKLEFAKIVTQYYDDKGKSRGWKTFFYGLFIVADFNKNTDFTTTVLPVEKMDLNIIYSKPKKNNNSFESAKSIKLEDLEFQNMYDVYSNNEIEARYILTPSMMRKLVDLGIKVSVDNDDLSIIKTQYNKLPYISFNKSKIFIAIPFATNLYNPDIDEDRDSIYIKKHKKIILMVKELIEDLDLNTRIWSKE